MSTRILFILCAFVAVSFSIIYPCEQFCTGVPQVQWCDPIVLALWAPNTKCYNACMKNCSVSPGCMQNNSMSCCLSSDGRGKWALNNTGCNLGYWTPIVGK